MKKRKDRMETGKLRTGLCRVGALMLAVILLLGTMTGCTSTEDKEGLRVIGESAGFDVLYEELRFVTLLAKDALEQEYGEGIWNNEDTAEAHRAELEERVLDNLRANYMILATCQAYSIDTDSDEVNNYVDEQIEELIESECNGKKSEYKKYLKENNLTDHFLRFSLKVSFLESILFYTLESNKVFAYTTENIDEFITYVMNSPDYARTIHVYLKNDEGESPEANLDEAEGIVRALRAVSGYDQRLKVMQSHVGSSKNDDIGSDVSGDGFYFSHGEMEDDYEDVAFGLSIGEVSDPFEFSNGYMIIMRLKPEEDYVIQNSATLLQYYQSAQMGLMEDAKADACTVLLNELGASIDLTAME